jgi:hypothetical protein
MDSPSNTITLNVGTWEPGDDRDLAGFGGVVRIDDDGCVYLGGFRPTPGRVMNVVWPAGYTAVRLSDGTVQITDPGGVVVAKSGQWLVVGGGEVPGVDLACRAEGTNQPAIVIQYELPPLND